MSTFVVVFNLPPELVFLKQEDWLVDGLCGDRHDSDNDDGGGGKLLQGEDFWEDSLVLQKWSLSAAFAFWSKVLP